MKVSIQAMRQELSEAEIKSHILDSTLARIKGKGVLKAYVVAHEGESQPRVLDQENQPPKLFWPKRTIQAINQKIKSGLKFFVNHGKDTNSHNGRKPVGEVVGSFVKTIKDKLSNVIIGYFENPDVVFHMDVNSMEADVRINEESNTVEGVNELTGIALGSSRTDSPAFPGAVRLASLQCFEKPSEEPKPGDGGKTMPTFSEIKQAVRDMNIYPHQLFSTEDMKSDRIYGKFISEHDGLTSKVAELTKTVETVKTESAETLRKGRAGIAKTRLTELLTEGLTEKQKDFIVTRFDADKTEDLSDEGLNSYIESSKTEYAEMAKIFSDKKPEDTNNEDEKLPDNNSDTEKQNAVDAATEDILKD